jgi:hypothetical protein
MGRRAAHSRVSAGLQCGTDAALLDTVRIVSPSCRAEAGLAREILSESTPVDGYHVLRQQLLVLALLLRRSGDQQPRHPEISSQRRPNLPLPLYTHIPAYHPLCDEHSLEDDRKSPLARDTSHYVVLDRSPRTIFLCRLLAANTDEEQCAL